MLTATEFTPTTTPLLIVLWIEAVVYLGIGLYETFDDFIHKATKWVFINDRMNSWIWTQYKIGHKMYTAICFMLESGIDASVGRMDKMMGYEPANGEQTNCGLIIFEYSY